MNEATAPKVIIAGTGVSNVLFSEVFKIFNHWIDAGEKKRVCIVPVNCIIWANKKTELREIYNSADLTLCDGVPILWASHFLGTTIKERITGLDLLPLYIKESYKRKYSMFFLGSKEIVNEILKDKLEKLYPGINIAGMYSPPFAENFSSEENKKIAMLINKVKPDILWVSLTAPKQDYWIHQNLENLNVHVAIGIGGALEVTAGLIKRAPRYMQKNGLEWLYRFIKEPKRLFRRYFIEAPAFFPLILQQKIRKKCTLKKIN